jgi:16S rRNA (guanine1516-N2)-methyltransferase
MSLPPKYKINQLDQGLSVHVQALTPRPFAMSFSDPKFKTRLQAQNLRAELLIKAIGGSKYQTVLDTTAGLGRDSLLMAAIVEKIVLLERHPDMYNLLADALKRCSPDQDLIPILKKVTLLPQCAFDFLATYAGSKFDIIYCDPMFPERKKSALTKKESQILQTIVGPDADSLQLVELALRHAKYRVVVKRPMASETLVRKPDIQYKARAHRFDVYLCP